MSEISNCMLLQIRKNNILKLEQLLKLNLVNDHIFIIDNNLAALYIDYKKPLLYTVALLLVS